MAKPLAQVHFWLITIMLVVLLAVFGRLACEIWTWPTTTKTISRA